jgi:hypothetical protein
VITHDVAQDLGTVGDGMQKIFTSRDPLVGEIATEINKALPGAVLDVNVPIKNRDLKLESDADIMLINGDVIEVKSGRGKGAAKQVRNQQKIIGGHGEVIVYGPNLKDAQSSMLQTDGVKVFKELDALLSYLKSKGLSTQGQPAKPVQTQTTAATTLTEDSANSSINPVVNVGDGTQKIFTSPDALVGETATLINEALPGAVLGVNVPIRSPRLSSEADIIVESLTGKIVIIEVKSGVGRSAPKQVQIQQAIIGRTGKVIVYGPNLSDSVNRKLENGGVDVFTNMPDLLKFLKSKGL